MTSMYQCVPNRMYEQWSRFQTVQCFNPRRRDERRTTMLAETTARSSTSFMDGKGEAIAKESWIRRNRSVWFPFILVAPYLVGIVWHVALHPTASVFTGDFAEARRWYIDENSLDPGSFRMNKRYNVIRTGENLNAPDAVSSMCDALEDVGVLEARDGAVVKCHENERDRLQIVSIAPSNTAISPTQEAVVVVVPFSDRWLADQLQYSVLQLVKRLATPELSSAPWMGSETVVLVSPKHNGTTMHDAVQNFLNLEVSREFIIRNVVVLDRARVTTPTTSGAAVELRLLPQGRRGSLPNMDLVFLMYRVFSQIPARQLQLSVHPFPELRLRLETSRWWRAIFHKASPKWQNRLLDLVLFEYALAVGTGASPGAASPFLPHSPALDLGIDSLTLQLAYDTSTTTSTGGANSNSNAIVAEVVSKLEPVIRALCNLHERLHHSTRLYLLVSPDRFVKHEEYLVPNLLLLIPLIIRAASLALVDVRWFDVAAVGRAAAAVVVGVLSCTYGLHLVTHLEARGALSIMDATLVRSAAVLLTAYLPLLWYVWRRERTPTNRTDESKPSIQFLACLVGLYMHVAIAFGHVSLAFPSAALWTPLLAFPYFSQRASRRRRVLVTLLNWTVVTATSPCVWLVPFVFSAYTPYVQYLYLPLHMFVAILLL
jgi:GPI-anchor transamidase subunit GAA1